MHGEISIGGHPKKEGQHGILECQPDHLLDPKHLHKFQVQAKKPHPRDRAFSQHIYVLEIISHHNYDKSFFLDVGESTDLGNTFWQAHFGKNRKTHLGRGLVKPSTEVLISRPRFYQALDRGI